MDPKTGKLTPREQLKVWEHPGSKVVVQPGPWGGHTWILSSYNPDTGLVYIPAFIIPQEFSDSGESGYDYALLPGAKMKAQGRLIAWDPVAQKERWHVDLPTVFNGGVLTTASELVFQGTTDGEFHAYDARSGRGLWSFDTHSIIEAGPSSVLVDGKQVIVVPAGDASTNNAVRYFPAAATTPQTLMAPSRLLLFGLGGTEVLPPTPLKLLPKPARARPTAALAAAGERLFDGNQCSLCHGHGLRIAGQGRIPDLRTLSEEQLEAMPAILQQGASVSLGMPKFARLTRSDITALQAYIEERAWEDYDQQQARARVN